MKTKPTTLLILTAGLMALAACSGDDPVQPAAGPADLDSFFEVLPAWDLYSPVKADSDLAVGEETASEEVIGGDDYNCTTVPYSITRTPDRIVTLNPDSEILWVGSLLQGQGYLNGIGSLAELPIRQRAPLSLSIDLLTENTSVEVDDPTLATVNQAIGTLVQGATDAGHVAGSNIMFTKETAHSLAQASLKMGLSASYMGASVQTGLSANISDEKRTVTAYYVQRMFTVSMVLPQTPESVFSDKFTDAMLDDQVGRGRMGPDNLPVYVSAITYGRLLMFSFTSTASVADIGATLNLVYNQGGFGGGVEMETRFQDILETAEIQVVAVGGDAEQAQALIRSNNLGEYFAGNSPLTAARPISYSVRSLKDNILARVSETTEYNLQECVPVVHVATGAEYNITLTHLRGVAFPTIDPWPAHALSDRFNAEIYYDFYIRNAAAPQLAANYEWRLLKPFAERIEAGQTHILLNPQTITVQIHYDGRDQVEIFGDVYDSDDDLIGDSDDRFARFRKIFQWPSTPLTAQNYAMNAGDADGNRVRLFWTVTKVRDLFD